jgi:hypothetical protein
MSERNPSTRRSAYRRIIKTLVGTVAVGAACVAIVASGTPTDASAKPPRGNGLPPDVEAMKEAFEAYIQSVESMAEQFVEASTFTLDDTHSVGAYPDQLVPQQHEPLAADRQRQRSTSVSAICWLR